jgi:hypothetical protein
MTPEQTAEIKRADTIWLLNSKSKDKRIAWGKANLEQIIATGKPRHLKQLVLTYSSETEYDKLLAAIQEIKGADVATTDDAPTRHGEKR